VSDSLTLLITIGAVLACIAAVAAAIDRSARAAAWRQIALERRWNHEQRRQRNSRS
jgi:hypothetical protein